MTAMGNRERKQIAVGHLGGVEQSRMINTVAVHDAYIIGPELVPRKRQ